MNSNRKTLTLDQPATYQIKVPGRFDVPYADWDEKLDVSIESEASAPPVTILTGVFDQAALHGLLRRLYSQGLPLISVVWIEGGSASKETPA
jgi:hypothetical protein